MVNGGRGSSPLPYHAPFMVNIGRGSSPLPQHAPFMLNGGHGSSPLTYHALFMMSINATRKIFQMISIAAYLFLHDYRLLLLSNCFRQEICQNIPRRIINMKKKKTKIIHENDAIQSENSPKVPYFCRDDLRFKTCGQGACGNCWMIDTDSW